MLKVVRHKQDTGQEFISHQQMVDIGTRVVLTAVTGAPFYEWAKVFLVPVRRSPRELGSEDYTKSRTQATYSPGDDTNGSKSLLVKAQGVL